MSIETKAQVLERHTGKPLPFNLAEIMHGRPNDEDYDSRIGNCYATGIKLLPVGTPEFDDAVSKWLKRFELSDDKTQEITAKFREQGYFSVSTPFAAWRWVNTDGISSIADGMPYQGILTDMKWLGIFYLNTAEMMVLPFGDHKKGPHRNLFYDAIGAKGASVKVNYTGTLSDAITEFNQHRPFTFHLARLPLNLEEIVQVMKQSSNAERDRRIDGLITETGVPFERVMEIISSDPSQYLAEPLIPPPAFFQTRY
jgi:hypothetical protein